MHTIFFKQRNSNNLKIGGMSSAQKPQVYDWWVLTKNKKGFMTLKEAVILIFAAILMLGMLGFVLKLQSAVRPGSDDAISIANFNRLYSEILEVTKNTNFEDERIFNYYIGKETKLVAFDTNGNENKIDMLIKIGKERVRFFDSKKPSHCGNDACICLYNVNKIDSDPDKRDDPVIECRMKELSDKNIVFENGLINKKDIINNEEITELRILRYYDADTKTYTINIDPK